MKPRIIPCVQFIGTEACKTKRFADPKNVGLVQSQLSQLLVHSPDEIILLDISANHTSNNSPINCDQAAKLATIVNCPLAYGGPFRSPVEVDKLFQSGIERIIINYEKAVKQDFWPMLVRRYGGSSFILNFNLNDTLIQTPDSESLVSHIEKGFTLFPAEEGMLSSVPTDGMKSGLPTEILRIPSRIAESLIVGGGVGNFGHIHEALIAGFNGVVCGSIFQLSDNNPTRAASFLKTKNVPLKKLLKNHDLSNYTFSR